MRAYISTSRITTLVVLCTLLVIAAGLQRVGHTDASAADDVCRRAEQAESLVAFASEARSLEGGAFVRGGGDVPSRVSLMLPLEPGCYVAVHIAAGTDEDETIPVFPVTISCNFETATPEPGHCGLDEIVILRKERIGDQEGWSLALVRLTHPDAVYFFRIEGEGDIFIYGTE